jgi:hypothetical protein
MEIGELGGHRLADDDRAGGAQLRHYGGVAPRPASGGERRAKLSRVIRGIDDVLDRDRNAVERPDRPTLRAALVESARLRQRMVDVEMDERLDLTIERFNALQAGARIILGRNRAAGDFRGGLARGQMDEPVVGQGCAPPFCLNENSGAPRARTGARACRANR